jgi:hypothetical protein
MPDDRCSGGFAHAPWVYGALSGIVVLYVGGLLLAAGPDSDVVNDAYEFAYPALELANVNNDWGFFSPDPGPGDLPRYEVIDGDGKTHRFELMETLDRWDPAFFRYTTLYVNLIEDRETYGDAGAVFLCRKHADLRPRKIVFTVAHQVSFSPQDVLDGKGILDDMPVEKLYFRHCDPEDE